MDISLENLFVDIGTYRGNKNYATCLTTLLQNELNKDVTRFTTHIKPVLQQIRVLTGLNVGGKMRNIAIQLVLRQCCKTSCTFFAARFSVPLDGTKEFILERTLGGMSCSHS